MNKNLRNLSKTYLLKIKILYWQRILRVVGPLSLCLRGRRLENSLANVKFYIPKKNFTKITSIIFVVIFLLSSNATPLFAQSDASIHIDLGVTGCNNNGICEVGENTLSCPADCPAPSTTTGSIIRPENIFLYNLSIEPNFTDATIRWNSSVGMISTIRWGETQDVKEGTLTSTVFAVNHKMELIHLKPGTMYFFTIESRSASGKTNFYPPTYFFTKFLKDTTFPLSPRNLRASSDISGITITWENPPDENFSYIRMMRHEDRFKGNPFSGKLIYEGSEEKFLDKNVISGKKYFYVLFAKDVLGNFSGGVGVSQIAYSEKKIPIQIIEEELSEISIIENFFVHQYNQLVELLTDKKTITVDSNKSTVVDTNSKTLSDDWMKVTNAEGKVIGEYLFSFNMDSGRYQSVIPPLEKTGTYDIKIYRYQNDVLTLISESSLFINKDITPKIEKTYNISYFDFIYLIILSITLFLLLFFLRKKQKNPIK